MNADQLKGAVVVRAELRHAEAAVYDVRAHLTRAAARANEEGVDLPEDLAETEQLVQALLERVRGHRRELTTAIEAEAPATPEIGVA